MRNRTPRQRCSSSSRPARASSRICAASCIGLIFLPDVLASCARRLSCRSVALLIGTLGCRTHFVSVGRPARLPWLGIRRDRSCSTIWARRAAPNAPPPTSGIRPIGFAPRRRVIVSMPSLKHRTFCPESQCRDVPRRCRNWLPPCDSKVVREGIKSLSSLLAPGRARRVIGLGRFHSGIPDLGSNKDHLKGFGR